MACIVPMRELYEIMLSQSQHQAIPPRSFYVAPKSLDMAWQPTVGMPRTSPPLAMLTT